MMRITHGEIRRGKHVVLHAAELDVPVSGVCGIVGINGAGKSTMMHALTGTLRGRRNSIAVPGMANGGIAYGVQQSGLPEWLPTRAVPRLYALTWEAMVERAPGLLLEELADGICGELSVGQRTALCTAIALSLDVPLTLLDEPFAPLDFRRRIGLVHLLQQRRSRTDRLTLVSSQSAVDLLDTCDWIVVLREGRYVHSGAADSLTGGATDPGEARQRFESAVMLLLDAASPQPLQGWQPAS